MLFTCELSKYCPAVPQPDKKNKKRTPAMLNPFIVIVVLLKSLVEGSRWIETLLPNIFLEVEI
ncbi:MAG: hypothetical protein CMH77_00390 [Nitrospinae bacterium]|nr:hypothetical protein [Nitrospinota bacterium]